MDINCDMGESFGQYIIGNDDDIFPYITSCNIACGFHGGDPYHIEKTIRKALEYGVQIGAHPSYPDLQGFGRRKMTIGKDELKSILKYQISALKGMTESLGGILKYVKPHGALYNTAAVNEAESYTIIEAILEVDSQLILMGLAGSNMEAVTKKENVPFIPEAFADRLYTTEGKLMPRQLQGAVIHDAKKAAEQVLRLVQENEVISNEGTAINIKAKSICIHGDNPNAINILQEINRIFQNHHISKKAF